MQASDFFIVFFQTSATQVPRLFHRSLFSTLDSERRGEKCSKQITTGGAVFPTTYAPGISTPKASDPYYYQGCEGSLAHRSNRRTLQSFAANHQYGKRMESEGFGFEL
jgi:hypothetical protein